MVRHIAGLDVRGMVRVHERRRRLGAHALERSPGDRVPVRPGAGHVEQHDFDTGIGEVARDARTHGSGTDDRGTSNVHERFAAQCTLRASSIAAISS